MNTTATNSIDDELAAWITAQPLFFVASAPTREGHINVSPKGYDTLRVIGPTTVAYLDLTGSGAETIAHVTENGRVTLMLCAFDGPPRILRLYGSARWHRVGTTEFEEISRAFEPEHGARAVIVIEITRVQTSCGFAVPLMSYREERPTLRQWAARRAEADLASYREEHNTMSIDGLPAFADPD